MTLSSSNPQKTAQYWNTISYTAVQCSFAQRVLPSTVKSHSDYPHTTAWEPPPHEITTYRLLPIISKVLEKLPFKRLLPIVERNQSIPK
jgi:hypothetical protein